MPKNERMMRGNMVTNGT